MARSKKSPKGKSPKKVAPSSQSLKKKDERKKPKFDDRNFKVFIHKVMKQVFRRDDKDITIGKSSMITLNDFMLDVFERVAREASALAKIDREHRSGLRGKKIVHLTSRHIQTAVRFVLPGELGKHAVVEGTKAVQNYYNSKEKH